MTDPTFETALAAARAYCATIDQRRELELDAFLVAVHRTISALYATVLALPEIEPPEADYPDGWSHADWSVLYHDLQGLLGPLDHYREIFHPYEDESEPPVVGSLADALADVYGVAVNALSIADQGMLTDAAFDLGLQFEIIAGHGAVDAMRAIDAHRFHSYDE